MFGSDRIQTRFRGLETSSLVGVAPGYFSVASATALLLSFTALQYRQRGTFEQSNVTGLGHRVFPRILLGRCSHVGARRKQRVLCGCCLPLVCSTGACREESVMRSLPSLALARREQRVHPSVFLTHWTPEYTLKKVLYSSIDCAASQKSYGGHVELPQQMIERLDGRVLCRMVRVDACWDRLDDGIVIGSREEWNRETGCRSCGRPGGRFHHPMGG